MNSSRLSTASHARLRNSCDACNTAKVKCSKERPCCRRCERRGVDCVYSVSLRPSKRPQHDPAISTAMPTTMPTALDSAFDFNAQMQMDLPELDDYFSTDVLADFPSLSPTQTQLLVHQQQLCTQPQISPSLPPPPQQQIRPMPPMPPMPPTPPACVCQQMILAKLSALSPAAARTHVLPFDRALSENRSIVALCTSTLDCSPCTRGDDAMLLLTLAALLAHVLGVFDAQFRARREALRLRDPDSCTYGSLHMLTPPPTAYTASAGGQATPSGSSTRECTDGNESRPFVRLSLGSYELDERDEQILQMNLFRIELSKIKLLVEAFEARLSRLGADHSDPANETKLHQDITTYLKQRLRANADALKRLARASGYVDM
jgi:hypothetical protein